MNNNLLQILESILKSYDLCHEKVVVFEKLFFPVIKAKLCLKELVFERFDEIEKAVLSLIYYGVRDLETLAHLLSLSPEMITAVELVLRNDGALEDHSVTALGEKLLCEDTLEKTVNVWESIYICPLTLILFSKMSYPKRLVRAPLENTSRIIEAPAEIRTYSLKSRILESPEQFISKRKNILGSNIVDVEDLEFNGKFYYPCFLLIHHSLESPVVFYEPNRKSAGYSFIPLSIGSEKDRKLLNLDNEITKHDKHFTEFLKRVGKKFYE